MATGDEVNSNPPSLGNISAVKRKAVMKHHVINMLMNKDISTFDNMN